MMLSLLVGGTALVLPYVVVPIRKRLGLPTYQWDADPNTHPVRARAGARGAGARVLRARA